MQRITRTEWQSKKGTDRITFIQKLSDVKEGIGLPLLANGATIYHPDALISFLDKALKQQSEIVLEGRIQ